MTRKVMNDIKIRGEREREPASENDDDGLELFRDDPSIRTNIFACLELARQSFGQFARRLVTALLSKFVSSSKAALRLRAAPAA